MSFDSDSSFYVQPSFDDADAGYAPHLEKDYCSNFVCCGVTLADLHELVSHFEENHVTVLSPDGAPLPSETPESPSDLSSGSSALESPRSAYPTTPPPPNLFPTLTSAFTPRESAFTPVTTSSSRDPCLAGHAYNRGAPSNYLAKEEEHVFDAMLHSEVYDHNAGPAYQASFPPGPQICVPPAQFFPAPSQCGSPSVTPQHTTSYSSQPNHNTPKHVYPPTLAPTPVYARHPNLSIITDLQPEACKPVKKRKGENNASWVSASEGEDVVLLTRRRKKAPVNKQSMREKRHRCPRDGCVKSYMNQNGLKYHLTKGVCDFGQTDS